MAEDDVQATLDAVRESLAREFEDYKVLLAALEVLERLEQAHSRAIYRDTKKQHTRARDGAKNIRDLIELRYKRYEPTS